MQVLFNTAGMPDVVFEISIGKHKNYCAGCTSRMGMPAVPRTMSGARIVGRSIVHQRQQAIIMNAYEVGVLFPRKEGEGYEASTISTPGWWPMQAATSMRDLSSQVADVRRQLESDDQLRSLMAGLRGANIDDSDYAADGVTMSLVEVHSMQPCEYALINWLGGGALASHQPLQMP